jgi:hypothetical protein
MMIDTKVYSSNFSDAQVAPMYRCALGLVSCIYIRIKDFQVVEDSFDFHN